MRRRRSMLVMGALLVLCLCCILVVGVAVLFRSGHFCGQEGAETSGNTLLVRQDQTVSSIRACGGSVTVLGHVTGDVSSYGGSISIGRDGHVDGDVSSYGGGVEIAGEVQGEVQSYGGAVRVEGSGLVHGDVTAYGGGVRTDRRSQVEGAIHSKQGYNFGWSGLSFFSSFALSFSLWSVVIWAVLAAALVHWVRERVLSVGEVMVRRLPRSLAVGALSWVLGLVLAFILAFTIIGLPLTIGILLVLGAGAILGNVALGWMLGRSLLHKMSSREHSAALEAVVGVVILSALGAIPFFGGLLSLFIAVVGVGAALLSRFGSRRWNAGSLRRWSA